MKIKFKRLTACLPLVGAALLAPGCMRAAVKVEPIKVEPIHITMDINIKVDRALENFFDDLDQEATAIPVANTTKAPAATPAEEVKP